MASTVSAWIRDMSGRPMGTRLAPLPPAWGPAPVVAAPAASDHHEQGQEDPGQAHEAATPPACPARGAWAARRQSTTATASRAMPTMKWVMTT